MIHAAPKSEEEITPFETPEVWAHRLESKSHRLIVYFAAENEKEVAKQTLELIEHAWTESTKMGFADPTPYNSFDQGRFAVFLVQGDENYVDTMEPVDIDGGFPSWPSFIGAAPWGVHGGERLASTLAHEFHHAVQAAYDWEEDGNIYEMSANYVQERFFPGENEAAVWEISDFQSRAERAPHYNDDYKTDFMYGSWLYLKFLEYNYFQNKSDFLVKLWERASPDNDGGNRTWIDALETLLPKGTGYADTVVKFARWRTFRDTNSRGQARKIEKLHLQKQSIPIPRVHYRITATDKVRGIQSRGLQLLGTHYIEVLNGDCKSVQTKLEDVRPDSDSRKPETRWKTQKIVSKRSTLFILTAVPKNKTWDMTDDTLIPYRFTAQCVE